MEVTSYHISYDPHTKHFSVCLPCGHALATIHPLPGTELCSKEAYATAEAIRQAMMLGDLDKRIEAILRAIK